MGFAAAVFEALALVGAFFDAAVAEVDFFGAAALVVYASQIASISRDNDDNIRSSWW